MTQEAAMTPKLKRTRILLTDGDQYRALCGINAASASSETGGLMVDLSSAPMKKWKFGITDLPPGSGPMTAPARPDAHIFEGARPPKLHFHKTGYVSLNATDTLPRQGIMIPDLFDIEHDHCFTLSIRHPWELTAIEPRREDSIFHVHGDLTTVKILGRIGQASNLREPWASDPRNPVLVDLIPDDRPITDTSSSFPLMIVRMDAHGLDCYAWLELHANPDFNEGLEGPSALLFAFDPTLAKNLGRPAEILGVWSLDGVPD